MDTAIQRSPIISAGGWLLSAVPWSVGEHRIGSVGASGLSSFYLDIEAGSACLSVERRTWHSGLLVTHVVLTYPGDRHSVVALFGR